ncbi:hypothetical protein JTB14_016641 [Gonioctena quinquepunctata]|nr:hypothetical protein JTB14_016641 [Gonioctena quinquepunctata]
MWFSIITIFVTLCYGVSAEENRHNDYLDSSQKDPHPSPSRREEINYGDGNYGQGSQNSFYPSYPPYDNQPLGHSRPFYHNNQQEGAYSQKSQPYENSFESPERYSGYKDDYSNSKSDHLGLLGSGNFGVIPGGTFYNDNDGEHSNYGDYDSYLNGHGGPSFYYASSSNPKPYPHEQFANFRDFADINTPSDRQYSQYVIVYVPNKNGTATEDKLVTRKVPKNIMESLSMLDSEPSTSTESDIPQKKLSKAKRKLATLLPDKKYLQKSSKKVKALKDLEEPLIALS